MKIITFILLLATIYCYSQPNFDQNIYQYAFRKQIILTNRIQSIFVIENIEGKIDTIRADFNKDGIETTSHFFIQVPSNLVKTVNDTKICDSSGRIIKTINPSGYNIKECIYEYKKDRIIRTCIHNDKTVKNLIYTNYFDKNKNWTKEARSFTDGSKLEFKYKYENNNLLTTIINGDGTEHKILYVKWGK